MFSASPQRTDNVRRLRHVRNVPEADVLHSITSSARARIEGGMVRPSALAVFRLMTSWYLEACSTGRSAGFAPFDVGGRAPGQVQGISPVAHQPARLYIGRYHEDGRQ